MTYHYRGSRSRGTSSRALGAIGLVILVGGGGFGVLQAIAWFRANAEAAQQVAAVEEAAVFDATNVADVSVEATTSLRSGAGDVLGAVHRSGTVDQPLYSVILQLPAIDVVTQAYEMWMVKEGLADVKSVGMLLPRADGSWTLEWTMQDPLAYTSLVVMLEPVDGNAAPSGNKVSEGIFE